MIIETSTDVDLSLKLNNFEGPLDLLLHLVKENKIEIKNIFLSEVTQQFLLYMSQLSCLDIDKASEYMDIAATLLEIKSRSLLPVMPELEDDENNPEKILIRQLEEYKMLKEASTKLKEHEIIDRLFKAPSDDASEVRYIAKDMSLDNLLDAFAHLLNKIDLKNLETKLPKVIKKDSFSVADKIEFIKDMFVNADKIKFSELFDETVTINEIVVTFSALLELLKLQLILVTQDEQFGEITIFKTNKIFEETDYDETEIG